MSQRHTDAGIVAFVLFLLLGPFIGLVGLNLFVAFMAVLEGELTAGKFFAQSASDFDAWNLVKVTVVSYLAGGIPAALTGAYTGVRIARTGWVSLPELLLAALAASAAQTAILKGILVNFEFWFLLAIMTGPGLFAAFVLYWLMRGLTILQTPKPDRPSSNP